MTPFGSAPFLTQEIEEISQAHGQRNLKSKWFIVVDF